MHSTILSLISEDYKSEYKYISDVDLTREMAPAYIDYISEAGEIEFDDYKELLDTTLEKYKDFITINKDGFTITKPKELNEFLNQRALEEIIKWISDTETAQHLISNAYKLEDALGRGMGGLLIYNQEYGDLCPFISWLNNQTVNQDYPITFKLMQTYDYHW